MFEEGRQYLGAEQVSVVYRERVVLPVVPRYNVIGRVITQHAPEMTQELRQGLAPLSTRRLLGAGDWGDMIIWG